MTYFIIYKFDNDVLHSLANDTGENNGSVVPSVCSGADILQ